MLQFELSLLSLTIVKYLVYVANLIAVTVFL